MTLFIKILIALNVLSIAFNLRYFFLPENYKKEMIRRSEYSDQAIIGGSLLSIVFSLLFIYGYQNWL